MPLRGKGEREATMANHSKAKLKLLYIRQILEEETDAEHGLTMSQLLERLDSFGIPAERKGVYRDLQTLRDFGLEIQTYQRNPVEYALIRHDFTLSELMLLVDAVESCKFLTRRQSNALTTNLKLFASDHQRALLSRRIHVQDRITSKNDSVFEHIDTLHEAMHRHKKIEFMYYRLGIDGKPTATHNGKPHVVTPVLISYADGFYYLTAWNDNHEAMTEFRIDRMKQLRITDLRSTTNDEITHFVFDGNQHEYFGRFNGEPVTATLLVDADHVEIVMDRFGKAAMFSVVDESTAKAIVKIRKSQQFFGWIAGLGNTVRIDGPASLAEDYRAYLQSLLDS